MIKVKLIGNLGNQLFQLALAEIIKNETDETYIFDTNDVKYQLGFFVTSNKILESKYLFKIYNFLQKKIIFKSKIIDLDCSIENQITFSPKTNYVGYFQNAQILDIRREFLLNVLKVKQKHINHFKNKYAQILENQRFIVMSVRRGDYNTTDLKEYIGNSLLIPHTWYENQLKNIETTDYKILVISDDIEAVKLEFSNSLHDYIYINDDVINQFLLLQHADICIIGNSTFAWWGAFLNSKTNRRVIAPKNFLGFNTGIELPKGIQTKFFEWVQ